MTDLHKDKAFIGGSWVSAAEGETFSVTDPASGHSIAQVPDMGAADAQRAVAAAHEAFGPWAALTGRERADFLYKWHDLIVARADDLAAIMTAEQGKPLSEARGEVLGGAATVRWCAGEAQRVNGEFIPGPKRDTRIIVARQPVGVVGAITPWNFPSSMITRKLAPALAAGCTAVLKPAEDTPLSALALAALAEQAGIPAGVFNIVTASLENAPEIGRVLTEDPRVRKISFTGSTEIGQLLMKQASGTVKKISLELGGNAPFIVFESADLDKAVNAAFASKFRNAGQTCISANRIYVNSKVYQEFTEKLLAKIEVINVGPGNREGVTMGPLINEQGVQKVEELLIDALKQGAKTVCGGSRHPLGGSFFEPTLLTHMHDNMRMAKEEIFGPVAPLYRFDDEEEVIARANNTEYGLAAYFYGSDLAQAWRVAERLESGMVAVNEPLLATETAPFGGIKQSGIGREGGRYGIEAFTEIKYILMGTA